MVQREVGRRIGKEGCMLDIEQVRLAGLEEQAKQGAGRMVGLNRTHQEKGECCVNECSPTLFPALLVA